MCISDNHGNDSDMKCTIIASGSLDYSEKTHKLILDSDLIICADGGAGHLRHLDIMPHIMIGDFDSISQEDLAYFQEKNIKQVSFSSRKDQTDTELSIQYAVDHGIDDITMLGVTGSRLDHSLGNIFLLKNLAEKNITARIIDKNNEIYLINNHIELKGEPGQLVSLIPASEKVTGITLLGFEYPLENGSMKMGSSLGISNCMKGTRATVEISAGFLIVILSED